MKKIFALFSLILCAICISACKDVPIISYSYEKIELALNEEFVINENELSVSDTQYSIVYKVRDEDIVKLEENTLIPQKVGETFLEFYLEEKPEVFILVGIKVDNRYLTQNASVTRGSVSINLSHTNTYINQVVIDENSTEEPEISYDENVIDYDYKTGLITAKTIGSTRVDIIFKKCQTSFMVIVSNEVYATYMHAEDIELYAKTKGKFDFTIFPANANQYVFFTNDATIKVSETGEYELLTDNNALVHYYFYKSQGVKSETKTFKIKVIKPIDDFETNITNLDGSVPSVYMLDKTYRMHINLENITNNNLQFSSNIVIFKNLTYSEEDCYIEFQFLNKGENEIIINYNKTLSGQENNLRKVIKPMVYDGYDIKTVAKFSAYVVDRNKVGNYNIYLNENEMLPTYLNFQFYLGENLVMEDITINCTYANENYELNEYTFDPNVVGEYLFQVKYKDNIIDGFIVFVE